MSTQTLTREERIQALLEKHGADMQEEQLQTQAINPKRYFVGEYDSGDLVGLSTVDTLDAAEAEINESEGLDFAVFDLDTGKEHYISWTAKIDRNPAKETNPTI